MRPIRTVLISCTLVLLPGVLGAQRLRPQRFRSYEPSLGTGPARPPGGAVRLPRVQDYRYEGLVAGALVVGTGAAILFHALCGIDDSSNRNCTWLAVKGGLGGAALGGLTGALIGGMIPKHEASGP